MMRKQRRRLLACIAVGIAGLVLLCLFLNVTRTAYSEARQTRNAAVKLAIAKQRLIRNGAFADDHAALRDRANQVKVDTLRFFLEETPGYAGDFAALAIQSGFTNCYVFDQNGALRDPNAGTPSDAARRAFETRSSVTDGDLRYYASTFADGSALVGCVSIAATREDMDALRAYDYSLRSVRVGDAGYVMAVDPATGAIAYHPDTSLVGQDAASVGIAGSALQGGYAGWITMRGERYFANTAIAEDGAILIAVVTSAEMVGRDARIIALSLLVYLLVAAILIVGAYVMHADFAHNPDHKPVFKKLGKNLYLNTTVAMRLGNIALSGLVAVMLLTFYAQSISAIARQYDASESKLNAVADIMTQNDQRGDALSLAFQGEYVARASTIAAMIAENPALLDRAKLARLAGCAGLRSIYVFDRNGATVATNTNFTDFTLSDDPGSQSYVFWNVVKGYWPNYVQSPQPDDAALHEYTLYVGVTRVDERGMVQIGVDPQAFSDMMDSATIGNVLSNIAVEDEGFLYALDTNKDMEIVYHPDTWRIGMPAVSAGLTDAALANDYSGFQTLEGKTYFVVSRHISSMTAEYDDLLLAVAIPCASIYAFRLPATALETAFCLILFLVMLAFLTLTRRPSEAASQSAEGADGAPVKAQRAFFHVFSNNGRGRVVQSASSRWDGVGTRPWSDMTPELKIQRIIFLFLGAISVAAVLVWTINRQLIDGDSMLGYILSGAWEHTLNIFSLTYIGIVLLEVFVFTYIARRAILLVTRSFGMRGETIGRLIDSFIKYVSVIASLFYALSYLGIESSTLITSASILTLVVGFGSQSLIGDILAGVFIVFEGEFRVGDIVTIGDWRGTVREIGIRTTKIESAGNDMKIINNASISGVVNMTKKYSYAAVNVGIEYGESIEHVESILQTELPAMRERLPAIVSGPFYKGVSALSDSSVTILIVAQCLEGNRAQLERDMNRAIKLIFDRHNISIPFPQVVVNQPEKHQDATWMEKRVAERFVETQKELGKDVPTKGD